MDHLKDGLLKSFLNSLWLEKGLSQNTISAYRSDLRAFEYWLEQKEKKINEVRREHILSYLSSEIDRGKKTKTIARTLSCLRTFFKFLRRENYISSDPTLRVDSPKLGRMLPNSLSETDVDILLTAPDLSNAVD